MAMIEGVEVEVDPEAVVVTSRAPLVVLSSAVVNGGFVTARSVVNLHVGRDHACETAVATLAAFARRRTVPEPWVGLLTAAWTERAEMAAETAHGLTALAVVTVGLSHPVSAGLSPPAPARPGTINTIVVVDAAPEPAAMVNLATSVTEVKALVLGARGVRDHAGAAASGTSTDAVVIAATGRGASRPFGGPISDVGWVVARAARTALEAGVERWLDERR